MNKNAKCIRCRTGASRHTVRCVKRRKRDRHPTPAHLLRIRARLRRTLARGHYVISRGGPRTFQESVPTFKPRRGR